MARKLGLADQLQVTSTEPLRAAGAVFLARLALAYTLLLELA